MTAVGGKKQCFLCYSNWSRGDCRASFVLVAQSVPTAVPLGHNLSLSALQSFKSSVFLFSYPVLSLQDYFFFILLREQQRSVEDTASSLMFSFLDAFLADGNGGEGSV